MHPEFFTLPILGIPVKSYGFCLMVGFLSGVWLAMRRAERVKADSDVALDIGFLCLIFGVTGARLFYVAHYWNSDFAHMPNKLLAAIDITGGGLEFLGGFLGALVAILIYAWRKRISVRLYMDVYAPSVMWGLAFGRLGCFLNGCCFGGLCVTGASAEPAQPWAMSFPFGSPAHVQQWEDRQVSVPAELITTSPNMLRPWMLPASVLAMSVEKREKPIRNYENIKAQYELAKAEAPDAEATANLKKLLDSAAKARDKHETALASLRVAQRFPSREVTTRGMSVSELEKLAMAHHSLPVHPTQLYSSINAFLLSGLFTVIFYRRKRHGVVVGLLFVLYPIPRTLLEIIRTDNPPDFWGLTVSQFVSLAMVVVGLVYLWIIFKHMPERSPVLESADTD